MQLQRYRCENFESRTALNFITKVFKYESACRFKDIPAATMSWCRHDLLSCLGDKDRQAILCDGQLEVWFIMDTLQIYRETREWTCLRLWIVFQLVLSRPSQIVLKYVIHCPKNIKNNIIFSSNVSKIYTRIPQFTRQHIQTFKTSDSEQIFASRSRNNWMFCDH